MSQFVSNLLLAKKSSAKRHVDEFKYKDIKSYINFTEKSIMSLIKKESVKANYKNPKILKDGGPYSLTDEYGHDEWIHTFYELLIVDIPKETNIPNLANIIERKINNEIKVKPGMELSCTVFFNTKTRRISLSIKLLNK